MRFARTLFSSLVIFTSFAFATAPASAAQARPAAAPAASQAPQPSRRKIEGAQAGMPGPGNFFLRSDMHGRWWKDSELVKELGLDDAQVQKIDQAFQESRLKLIDLHAELQRQEARLEPLVESDTPDEAQIAAQIDKIAAARGALEKANALMLVSMRRILTLDQWHRLQAMHPPMHGIEGGPMRGIEGGHMMKHPMPTPMPDQQGPPRFD